MGAIAGWIAPARRARGEEALGPMLETLAHRRAPGEGISGLADRSARQQVVLGTTLRDDAAGISVALDGTIANAAELRGLLAKHRYTFKEKTGAEALLRAYQYWDKDVVKHLRGPFAFAIWDSRKERLLLARDRFGEKPLFLREQDGALYFASEIKALLAAPGAKPETDMRAVWDYLAYGYVPGSRTLFSGVRKLAPGTYAAWQLGRLSEVRYWIAPDRDPPLGRKNFHKDAPEGATFVERLDEAVRLQREGGAGLLLSGGLDSAVLGALMARQGGELRTFSLGFEGDPRSELREAAAAAKHFGARHHEISVAPRDLVAALPKLIAQRDAPLARPSDLAVHRLVTEAGASVRVVLSGDGCDEVLGGYRRYIAERAGLRVRSGRIQTDAERDRLSTLKRDGALRLDGRSDGRSDGGADRAGKLRAGDPEAAGRPPFDADPRSSKLRRMFYSDQTGRLPDDLLERGDRLAMGASVELRAPYLDHLLAEYVSGQPDELRVRGLSTKWVLREAGRELLPPELRKRPKGGFRLPVADWLRGELREPLLDHLQGAGSLTRKYYDAGALDRALHEHLKNKHNHESLLWTLLNLEIWHRTYARA
jgi:asparagine synthase (glutamine-hydrolysing)